MPSQESRPFLLAALGMAVASLLCTAALTLRLDAEQANYRIRYAVYEERLAHMSTRLGAARDALESLRGQQVDLWDWHRESMQVADRLRRQDEAHDAFLTALDDSMRGLFEAVGEMQRRPPWTPPTNTR